MLINSRWGAGGSCAQLGSTCVVHLAVRVAGPWRERQELADALPSGYRLNDDGTALLLPGGAMLELSYRAADAEFPEVFLGVCRQQVTSSLRRAIRRYTACACMVTPATSLDAVRRMLDGVAAVMQAGGVGVLIDNALHSHGAAAWMEMAASDDTGAAICAFVSCTRLPGLMYSTGMHVFGHRDAYIVRGGEGGDDRAGRSLYDFHRHLIESAGDVEDAMKLEVTDGILTVRAGQQPSLAPPTNPSYNPFGWWELRW